MLGGGFLPIDLTNPPTSPSCFLSLGMRMIHMERLLEVVARGVRLYGKAF
jgi:hypothetical protein